MTSKLRHIALSVPDPWAAAEFYQKAFGFRKVGETDSSLARGVYLTDGTMSIALLNYKSDGRPERSVARTSSACTISACGSTTSPRRARPWKKQVAAITWAKCRSRATSSTR